MPTPFENFKTDLLENISQARILINTCDNYNTLQEEISNLQDICDFSLTELEDLTDED